ncbi:DUF2127 domain-containing protein [Paraburkholderia sp. EG287B]|uniref:DUF2127 domain-containing protein n=1 Tax=Paraburkholderia sp. EG287B TaxID=3237010 RepID=UPI0034D29173
MLFDVTLWVKAVMALVEGIAGIAICFAPTHVFYAIVLWVVQDEFAENPTDRVASFLLHSVSHFAGDTQRFTALYLFAHGVVKLWLVAGLLRTKLWYFPVSLVIFGLFISYQLYRYTVTRSGWLLFMTGLDIVVIMLTWHEYRYLRYNH